MSFSASVTEPEDIPAYWASVDGLAGVNLFNQLSAATGKGYSSLGYDGLWSAYTKTDVYPSDSVGRVGEIWDMYSACHFTTSQHGSYSKECDRFNREHSVPQSWWGGGTGAQGNDIFHVVPTDGYVNNWRGNDPYGEVVTANKTSTNGCKSGSSKLDGYSGTVFEPADQYKGDIARGILGAMTKWKGSWTSGQGSSTFNGSYTEAKHFGLTEYAVDLFMRWHREDPVSRKEVDRNNGIQQTQGNRNPFIDYPYMAEYIWGEHAGETIDMSKLMPSSDPEFVPGVSSGWRGDDTPVVPVPMYGVNWSVNGETVHVDSIKENKKVSSLPETPTSCSAESEVFMGWTDAPISGIADEAPEVLYTKVAQFPSITEDMTFYAVFAHATVEEGAAAATYTYSVDNKDENWTNNATNKTSYYVLAAGKTLVSPEIDLSGLDTIRATLRTFGGTQYDEFAFAAGSTQIGVIEVTGGGTLKDYEWVNTEKLSGKSPITFSCTNASGNNGTAFSSVTIVATGAGTTYSRYITVCQSTEEIELIPIEGPARKLLIGGHVYIMLDNRLYNLQGQRIK